MIGHWKRDCPTKVQQQVVQRLRNDTANRGTRKMQDKANVYVKMTIFGKEVPCLLDSGCETTLIPKQLFDQFKNLETRTATNQVRAANDTPIRISGEIRLPFCIDDCFFWTDALVSEDIEEVMLGSD